MSRLFIAIIYGVMLGSTSLSAVVPDSNIPPVTITLDTEHPGAAIAPDFTGLSFEVAVLRPNGNGVRYFRPDNLPLINLFHTLGIKNLRIGGNTSDRDARDLPQQADLDSLFEFAQAADVKVIYCLRLHNGDPLADIATAKYIMSHYAPQMDSFSIGQEPSAYPVEKNDKRPNSERMGAANEKYQYRDYAADWKKFADAIIAAVPDAKFCGPSVHNNGVWAQEFMDDFATSNHVALITEHLYAGGAGGKVPTPEIGRDRMLSTNFTHAYEKLYNSFVPQAVSNDLPYRLEEVNNYFNGGATNVSNTFASALWGLDFMYWWASHGAAGLNFHTGDRVAAGYALQPSKYTAFFSTTNGYVIRPLSYGIKAFALGSHGRLVPLTISNPGNLNLSAYAVLGDDKNLYCTLINKEHGPNANGAKISLPLAQGSFTRAEAVYLTAPQDDIAVTSGETLGGAQITEGGDWSGQWSLLTSAAENGFAIDLPPASAIVIKLTSNTATTATGSFELPDKSDPSVAWWRDSRTNLDTRLAWWRDARFGMFIHWGVYSGLGNEFQGRKGAGYAEHIQRVLKIPIPVYRKEVAGNFNPTNFNADEWVHLAHDAGMKYIVITAKHHDGFAMWPTKVNDYNIMDATPWHHDPMADLKAACDKYGIKFGFYYSQAFDWGNSNAPGNDWDCKNPGGDKHIGGVNWWETMPEFMESARKYVDTKAIPQLQELIRLYHPAILWFDTAGKLPPSENLRIMKAVREADPNVVISGRLVHGWGDYDDTTDRPANFPPHEGDWEAIPTTDESYGWNPFDTSHKPPSHFIQLLAKASARGGNMLLNIGPMGNGEIDPKDVAILKGIADWWKVNGESIRGTTRTPLPVQTWGESTRKGNTLYLHVFNWPTNDQLVVGGLKSDVKATYLQAFAPTGPVAEIFPQCPTKRLNPLDFGITLPNSSPATLSNADNVIVLQCAGDIQVDTNRLLQPEFPVETLRAFDAVLYGKGLKFGPGKKTDDVVMNWTKTNQFVLWPVRLNQMTKYEVTVDYDAPADSDGSTFRVLFELPMAERLAMSPEVLTGKVESGSSHSEPLGTVTVGPYTADIRIVPVEIHGDELMRLRNLQLRPVQ